MSGSKTEASNRSQTQREAIFDLLSDDEWHSLPDIMQHCKNADVGAGSAEITARIRDLRKEKYGGFNVACKKNKWASSETGRAIYDYKIDPTPKEVRPSLSERLAAENATLREENANLKNVIARLREQLNRATTTRPQSMRAV